MIITPDLGKLPLAIERSQTKEMLSITEENGKTIVLVNYSSFNIMQECGRKSQYSLDMGLRGKSDPPATLFGGAIHKALETFYVAPREERKIPTDFKEHSDLMAFGHAAPNDSLLYKAVAAFIEHAEPLRGLPPTDKRSLSSGVWLLQEYFKVYIDDPWEVYVDKSGPVVERRCERVLFDSATLKIILFGSIDVILRNAQNGMILPTDHKTSSIVGNDFYNRLKPNAQYTGYFWLAKETLGLEGDGFMVNCLEVKAKPLTARGGPPKFPRQVTTRTAEDIEEYKADVVSYVVQYLKWKKDGYWPKGSVSICTAYGGCPYLEVCGAPDNIRETMIENKFTKVGK